ncbi:MAG: hypothetical protein SFW62_06350 [Alphaproteobacteria bacterium]|nr:hypothetical protein [Alphaproteobacteria bacterium]
MNSQDNSQHLALWTLINLVEELEEINSQLDAISRGFDSGEIDFAGFEQAMLQLRDCQGQLEEVLGEPSRTSFIR